MKRTVLIVEDEPVAAETLQEYVADTADLELLGVAGTGPDAVEAIDREEPDVVLLDVELPEFSGVEVLLRSDHDPAVIFTTAYDQHAVTAFELGAFDYLVKPFGRGRFREALARLRERLDAGQERGTAPSASQRAAATLEGQPLERLFVRSPGSIVPVRTEEIVRLRARGDYVEVHHGGVSNLVSLSLAELERRLSPDRFQRVHRSHIVNMDHVERLEPHDDRRLRLVMDDGSAVVASRSGSSALRERIV